MAMNVNESPLNLWSLCIAVGINRNLSQHHVLLFWEDFLFGTAGISPQWCLGNSLCKAKVYKLLLEATVEHVLKIHH